MSTAVNDRKIFIFPITGIISGALAGLAGGLVFGMLMAMMGLLPMVAMLVRSENPVVGFIVHMVISALVGALYGVLAYRLRTNWGYSLVAGMVYGVIWWVLGALILMPLGLGMASMIFVIGTTQWYSLMGHLMYGAITALAYNPIRQRI